MSKIDERNRQTNYASWERVKGTRAGELRKAKMAYGRYGNGRTFEQYLRDQRPELLESALPKFLEAGWDSRTEEEPVTGVYCIRCSVNGKRYVGGSVRDLRERQRPHWRSLQLGEHKNKLLQADWDRYGARAFSFRVLEECSPEQCLKRETAWIKKLSAGDPRFGYNRCPVAGSMSGYQQADEDKAKKSAARKRWLAEVPGRGKWFNVWCRNRQRLVKTYANYYRYEAAMQLKEEDGSPHQS